MGMGEEREVKGGEEKRKGEKERVMERALHPVEVQVII